MDHTVAYCVYNQCLQMGNVDLEYITLFITVEFHIKNSLCVFDTDV